MDLSLVKLDINELIDEFTKEELSTLADMKRLWTAKKFSYIYEGCPANNNVALFMQSIFSYAIGHMVSESPISRRLGGLYCLYCLYETQPFKPCFKIYLSLGEVKRLKSLVIDAKENGLGVVPALVKRMLDKDSFLFGFVDMAGRANTRCVDDIQKLQDKRVQIAYEKLFANTKIEDYVHMSLGAELDLEALQRMSTDYEKAKELAVKEATGTVDMEDIKHIAESKKPVGSLVEEIVREWDAQKGEFYEQIGFPRNQLMNIDNTDTFEKELEQLLSE